MALPLAALLLNACSRNVDIPMAMDVFPQVLEAQPLTLSPGDTIEIKFRYEPDLSDMQMIRPDGMITLQEIDDVQAAGLTPAELDKKLTDLFKPHINEPIVSVVVRTLISQRVFVGGEVATPGLVELQGSLTALQAILAAGGFDKISAEPTKVIVIRQVGDKSLAGLLDLSEALENAENVPFFLQPQDIVHVPRSRIEEINLWVDKYINRTIPTGLDYSRQLDAKQAIGYSSPSVR